MTHSHAKWRFIHTLLLPSALVWNLALHSPTLLAQSTRAQGTTAVITTTTGGSASASTPRPTRSIESLRRDFFRLQAQQEGQWARLQYYRDSRHLGTMDRVFRWVADHLSDADQSLDRCAHDLAAARRVLELGLRDLNQTSWQVWMDRVNEMERLLSQADHSWREALNQGESGAVGVTAAALVVPTVCAAAAAPTVATGLGLANLSTTTAAVGLSAELHAAAGVALNQLEATPQRVSSVPPQQPNPQRTVEMSFEGRGIMTSAMVSNVSEGTSTNATPGTNPGQGRSRGRTEPRTQSRGASSAASARPSDEGSDHNDPANPSRPTATMLPGRIEIPRDDALARRRAALARAGALLAEVRERTHANIDQNHLDPSIQNALLSLVDPRLLNPEQRSQVQAAENRRRSSTQNTTEDHTSPLLNNREQPEAMPRTVAPGQPLRHDNWDSFYEEARQGLLRWHNDPSHHPGFDYVLHHIEMEAARRRPPLSERQLTRAESRWRASVARYRAIAQQQIPFTDRLLTIVNDVIANYVGRYLRDQPDTVMALLGQGGNCTVSTRLIAGAILQSGLSFPPEWRWGVQIFRDHIQVVLQNPESPTQALELPGGRWQQQLAGDVFRPEALLWNELDTNHRIHPFTRNELLFQSRSRDLLAAQSPARSLPPVLAGSADLGFGALASPDDTAYVSGPIPRRATIQSLPRLATGIAPPPGSPLLSGQAPGAGAIRISPSRQRRVTSTPSATQNLGAQGPNQQINNYLGYGIERLSRLTESREAQRILSLYQRGQRLTNPHRQLQVFSSGLRDETNLNLADLPYWTQRLQDPRLLAIPGQGLRDIHDYSLEYFLPIATLGHAPLSHMVPELIFGGEIGSISGDPRYQDFLRARDQFRQRVLQRPELLMALSQMSGTQIFFTLASSLDPRPDVFLATSLEDFEERHHQISLGQWQSLAEREILNPLFNAISDPQRLTLALRERPGQVNTLPQEPRPQQGVLTSAQGTWTLPAHPNPVSEGTPVNSLDQQTRTGGHDEQGQNRHVPRGGRHALRVSPDQYFTFISQILFLYRSSPEGARRWVQLLTDDVLEEVSEQHLYNYSLEIVSSFGDLPAPQSNDGFLAPPGLRRLGRGHLSWGQTRILGSALSAAGLLQRGDQGLSPSWNRIYTLALMPCRRNPDVPCFANRREAEDYFTQLFSEIVESPEFRQWGPARPLHFPPPPPSPPPREGQQAEDPLRTAYRTWYNSP